MFSGISEEYLTVLANDIACIINNDDEYTKKNPQIHTFTFIAVPCFKNLSAY